MPNPESKIVRQILEALKKKYPNSYMRKIHGNLFQHPGIPDILGCIDGRFIGLEVKTNNGKTSLIQKLEGSLIISADGLYAVVTDPDETIKEVERQLKIIKMPI